MYSKISYFAFCWLALAGIAADGNAQGVLNPANPGPVQTSPVSPPRMPPETAQVRPTYVLGPNDQMIIRARDVDEINEKTFRIEEDGTMTLPLIGGIKAAGQTIQQLEADIAEKLKALVRNPQVNITVTVFRQDPVFFLGAFQRPGIYILEGRSTLVDMLMRVGGLQPTASRYIQLKRKLDAGPIPLPGAIEDPAAKISTVDISLGSLSDTVNPAEDVVLAPNDVITAGRSENIYVQGAFAKTGVVQLDERESLSALQVITMSGGFTPDAQPDKAMILRPVLNTARRAAIPVDLTKVMSTKANDYPLMPNDILYVPTHKNKLKGVGSVAKAAWPVATGIIFLILSRL
jgi:polysaccharide biosynthesis/export protein